MVQKTLDGMAAGGMYDLVGGGFHRYSVDERWLVPHFEKMLYDNALLASTYLHALVVTGEPRSRAVVEETLDYVAARAPASRRRPRLGPGRRHGGVEGLTFTWTEEEGVPAELLQPFEHGRSIIRGSLDPELRAGLLAERELRPQPGLDDKVLASWNGLALAALAEGARRLERADWLDAARGVGEFLLGPLSRDGWAPLALLAGGRGQRRGFPRRLRERRARPPGAPPRDRRGRFLSEAHRLAVLAVELFHDPVHGGFFLAPTGGEELVARTKGLDDNPIPSGNSMLAHVLLRLARIWGDKELENRGVSVLRLVAPTLTRAPGAFGWTLCAFDLWLSPPRESQSSDPRQRRRKGRARSIRADHRRRVRPPPGCPSSRGRRSSTGSRRSTCASGLPVRRR